MFCIYRSGNPRTGDGNKLHLYPDPDDAGGGVHQSWDGQGAGMYTCDKQIKLEECRLQGVGKLVVNANVSG